ncbi:flagellar brake protein [Methylicorpusculum oleiharenae]|uniref:flagellar brake protein n=1 Tax=Methylicorpusculum oleiharenae TaxID=1338687 RepID=UPI001358B047|nr:flagellar brake protein [Methylicorpusculum oleiharenae]MCD2450034.1 flagellar brake protein [Methylicorpusculum oleiharenae]
MENEIAYLLKGKQQIISNLTLLLKQKTLITVQFGNNESFITTLIEIDPEKGILFFDYGPKDYLNKQLPLSTDIEFKCNFSGIRVRFEGKKIKPVKLIGEVVFAMPLPEKLFWFQRRRFYRVKSPLSKQSFVNLSLETEEILKLRVYDLSISGVSFLDDNSEYHHLWTQGLQYANVTLDLENISQIKVSLEISNCIPVNSDKPYKIQKIGCKLLGVSNAMESTIQKYMQLIERENKLKS